MRYEARKRSHLRTAELCDAAALTFFPFVVEADGGLGSDARRVIAQLAHQRPKADGAPAHTIDDIVATKASSATAVPSLCYLCSNTPDAATGETTW